MSGGTQDQYREAHERILASAASGDEADFTTPDDPDELPEHSDEDHWRGRTIDAGWFADLLVDPDAKIHRRGLRIAGVRLVGAFDLDGAEVSCTLSVRRSRFDAAPISMTGTSLRSLNLSGSACTGINADSAIGRGHVFLTDGFTATGEVRLLDANITGTLDCDGATLTNPDGDALSADRATIGGSVFLCGGFTATAEVRLLDANITGTLDCDGATFTNPNGDALSADRATIGGSVFLGNGFTATGTVRLHGANITGNLACGGATLTNPNGRALAADGATINGSVFLRSGFTATRAVQLTHVTAGSLCDDSESWPDRIDLSGFKYDRLVGPVAWKERAAWLRRQPSYDAQPYLHLARVLHEQGHERAARKIRMERHNVLLRPPAHWRGARPGRLECAWRWLLRLTIGHGYEPWRALLVAIPLIIGMTLWYTDAKTHDTFAAVADDPTRPEDTDVVHSSTCDPDYVCVQPFVYALDVILPIVDLGQRQAWAPDQSRHGGPWYRSGEWLAAATWGTTLVGWALATLTLASFSNAVKRE